ncbi:ABC transporter ATP-binding protein [Atopobiaceae bacterium 24-176]
MFLQLSGLSKRYGDTFVVDAMNLGVKRGTVCCLLGPSGCGKTTTLRMVGGYLAPDAGTVEVDGANVTDLPPEERPVSTVFQSYALFPHMTVAENVAYGLKCHGLGDPERRAEAAAMLDSVGLADYGRAYPGELSGGQQQRVALARSLVLKPKVLLLDEPLSNLDTGLRSAMRDEIRSIQRHFDLTMLFVTHDRREAMALGDTVAVMNGGKILQHGTPEEVYFHPADRFCAEFLGPVNELPQDAGPVFARVEDTVMAESGPWSGTVESCTFLGDELSYEVSVQGHPITLRSQNRERLDVGATVFVDITHRLIWKGQA